MKGHKKILEGELEGYGIRLNTKPPAITFRKKDKGGLNITSTITMTKLDNEEIKAICGEYRIHNADIVLRQDANADELIDVIEANRIYIPCIYVLNKIDQISIQELDILTRVPHSCPLSSHVKAEERKKEKKKSNVLTDATSSTSGTLTSSWTWHGTT